MKQINQQFRDQLYGQLYEQIGHQLYFRLLLSELSGLVVQLRQRIIEIQDQNR